MIRNFCLTLLLVLSTQLAAGQQTSPQPAIHEFLVLPQKRSSTVHAITGVRLIDGTGTAPKTEMTVLVQNGRIQAVGPSKASTVPKGAATVDAGGMTLVPGLMDSHFHLDS